MFGSAKLEVLQAKLDIYEGLSKEMLVKLERAVSTISDNSNKIGIVLERHENRLDEGERVNGAIIQMLTDHQKYDDRMFKQLDEKISELDKKTEKNTKFVIGATAVIATVVTVLQVAPPIAKLLTPVPTSATMGVVKPL